MPFIGQDWRAPGETWVRTQKGWERLKLKPYRIPSDSCLESKSHPLAEIVVSGPDIHPRFEGYAEDSCGKMCCRSRNDSDSSLENVVPGQVMFIGEEASADETEADEAEDWQPHCFVKTGKSKEFVGCTSISEAFHKLNLARAVTDVRRFNYICKVVQILIRDKLHNLSGSARKILLSIVEAIVLHSLDSYFEVKTVRELVGDFLTGLSGGQHCGSPKLLIHQQGAVSDLFELLESKKPATPAESSEESVTFLDLPRECLRAILRRLPDHECLLEAAKTHEALESLVESEQRLWHGLCTFHFADWQLTVAGEKLKEKKQRLARQNPESNLPDFQNYNCKHILSENWRHSFFELKKYIHPCQSYNKVEFSECCLECEISFPNK